MSKQFLQELISFMQQKAFVWGPEPEIYGGQAGFYTYGPMGKLLKNNVEEVIRRVFAEHNFFEVECPIVQPKKVWEASGHLGGFTDPVIFTKKGSSFRVDNLIEEFFKNQGKEAPRIGGLKDEEYVNLIKKHKIPAPNGEEFDFKKGVKRHNLMMKTTVGIDGEAYNRPETATTTYLQFQRYCEFFRKKLPFGIFQIGNAYRNEISPRQHLLRTREFSQAEAQLFIFDHQKNDFNQFEEIKADKLPFWSWKSQEGNKKPEMISLDVAIKKKLLKNKAYAYTLWLTYKMFLELQIPADKIRLAQHSPDEMAFYADDAWDVEVELNTFGWTEICGVHDRTDYDLKQHAKFSGAKMESLDENNEKKVPHILEIAFGPGRIVFALLDIYYDKKEADEGKSIFKIPPSMAPVKVSILPLMRKPELKKLAQKVYFDLKDCFRCKYDETGSIGKRYLRSAEEGTPVAITIDFDSLEDNSVTIRDRDTEEQERVKISELKEKLYSRLNK